MMLQLQFKDNKNTSNSFKKLKTFSSKNYILFFTFGLKIYR